MSWLDIAFLSLICFLGSICWGLFFRLRAAEEKIDRIVSVFDTSGITLARRIEDGTSYVGINGTHSWEDIELE